MIAWASRRNKEKTETDRLMREYLEKKLKEDLEKDKYEKKKWEQSSQMAPILRIFHKIVVYLQCITSATVNQIVHSYQTS